MPHPICERVVQGDMARFILHYEKVSQTADIEGSFKILPIAVIESSEQTRLSLGSLFYNALAAAGAT